MKKLKIILVFQILLFSNIFAQLANVTVNIDPIDGGLVTGTGIYLVGTNVQLDAIPNNGYNFLNWTNSGLIVSTDSNYSFIVLTNSEFDANFELKTFNIETVSEPLIGGTTTGDGIYSFGDNITVEAIPADGYSFVNWTEDNISVSTDSSFTFSAAADKKLVANFE